MIGFVWSLYHHVVAPMVAHEAGVEVGVRIRWHARCLMAPKGFLVFVATHVATVYQGEHAQGVAAYLYQGVGKGSWPYHRTHGHGTCNILDQAP